jgi:hypothetical protein
VFPLLHSFFVLRDRFSGLSARHSATGYLRSPEKTTGKKEKERSRKQFKREKAGQEREEGNCRRRRAEEARKPLCGRREPARKKVLFPFKI